MCAVGAASQISCCLLRTLFLIQNITCNLGRISFSRFVKCYTVLRFYRNHFGKKLFSHTMGRYFKEELCYVTSFISWFLEWGYRPVGGSFCINDGNDLKEYFVCFSYHHIYSSKLTRFKRAVWQNQLS